MRPISEPILSELEKLQCHWDVLQQWIGCLFAVKKRIVKEKSEYSYLLKKGGIHSGCIVTVRNVVVARLCFHRRL